MDSRIVEHLKKHAKTHNVEGKWIKLGFGGKDEA